MTELRIVNPERLIAKNAAKNRYVQGCYGTLDLEMFEPFSPRPGSGEWCQPPGCPQTVFALYKDGKTRLPDNPMYLPSPAYTTEPPHVGESPTSLVHARSVFGPGYTPREESDVTKPPGRCSSAPIPPVVKAKLAFTRLSTSEREQFVEWLNTQ